MIFFVRLIVVVAFGVTALAAMDAGALQLTGVKSRKVHAAAGAFDLTIDTSQAFAASVTVEPRTIGNGHVIVFQFDTTITATGTASVFDAFGPIGTVSAAITGASNTPVNNEVSVTLTGIPDNKRASIALLQVNGMLDVAPVSMGFLVGDVNNTRSANSSDISSVKARSGQTTAAATYVFDLNASGAINSSDISAVKARSGLSLPSANDVSLLVSKTGTGTGSVTSMPAGINCGSSCAANFAQGSAVTVSATADVGSAFSGFSGICAGAAPISTFVMATSGVCSATFTHTVSPLILYTDIQSGPNTGGENGNGIYLSIFGKNFGTSGLGTTTKVFINNAEVVRYISLGASRGRADIQQITVQIGALGNPPVGTPLPIRVSTNGFDSNTDQTFTVNAGNIYFVSLAGNDATGAPGAISSPYRTVQKAAISNNGVVGCPTASGNQTVATAGVWGLVQAGDFIVMRGGTWTDVARDAFFLRVQNKSGNAPTGTAGTGPITVMGYPTETVFINRTNSVANAPGGAFSSADSARQALGCGAWITLSNLKIESGFTDGTISTQAGASNPAGSHWRVVNNEMTMVSCQISTLCRAGGVTGSGLGNYWSGNYVHDVYDMPDASTSFENHGFYIDGTGSYEVAYNRIERIFGGNGIQTNANCGGACSIDNVSIHHNLIDGTGKHGINIADGGANVRVFDNLVMNTDVSGIRFNSDNLASGKIYHNTFYNTDRINQFSQVRSALMNDGTLTATSLEIRNNIFVAGNAGRYLEGGTIGFGAVSATMSHNLWFNGAGSFSGSSNRVGNPLFVSTTVGAENLRLQSTLSPAYCNGTSLVSSVVNNDVEIADASGAIPRPFGACFSIGAYEFH